MISFLQCIIFEPISYSEFILVHWYAHFSAVLWKEIEDL